MGDLYSRLDYRRAIAWPRRIAREWPFLERVLETGSSPRVLDLGCGTGEHARYLTSQGYQVVAVDASESMLARALEGPPEEGLEFVHGDLREIDLEVEGTFGGAICLGNTLPHLREPRDLERFFKGLRRVLEPDAPLLAQLLAYDRIRSRGERFLPLNFREDVEEPDTEVVFLRLMTTHDDGTVEFYPSALRLDPSADPPLSVEASKRVVLRGWKLEEIREALFEAGFPRIETFGSFDGTPFDPDESKDLVFVAR